LCVAIDTTDIKAHFFQPKYLIYIYLSSAKISALSNRFCEQTGESSGTRNFGNKDSESFKKEGRKKKGEEAMGHRKKRKNRKILFLNDTANDIERSARKGGFFLKRYCK